MNRILWAVIAALGISAVILIGFSMRDAELKRRARAIYIQPDSIFRPATYRWIPDNGMRKVVRGIRPSDIEQIRLVRQGAPNDFPSETIVVRESELIRQFLRALQKASTVSPRPDDMPPCSNFGACEVLELHLRQPPGKVVQVWFMLNQPEQCIGPDFREAMREMARRQGRPMGR